MKKNNTTPAEAVLGCVLVLIIIAAWGSVAGLVTKWIWNWLAPLFWTAAPHLNWSHSVGIWFVLGCIGSAFRQARSSSDAG